MKTKFLLIPALLLGATALGGAAVALANKQVARAAKADEISPYTIADDMYELAFFEQYNEVANCMSTEDYSYDKDRPLGVDTIGGHLYGNYGPSSSIKQTAYKTILRGGVNETLQWEFSGLNVKGKSGPNRLYIQLENNSSNWNICKPESFPQATYPDEYAIGQLITAAGCAKGAVMFSTTAIKNIKDISFYWRSSYAKKAFICYQIDGETEWKVMHTMNMNDSEKIVGNYSGTRGWDTYGYTTFNSESWTTKELYGKTAKIAFACTEAPTESGSFPLSAICINANNAAVRYLNALSYQDNVCSANGTNKYFDLTKGQADNVHNQDLFQLATEHADGSFLANYTVAGTKTSEYYTLGLYNHLVSSIPGLGEAKSASGSIFRMTIGNNGNLAVIISVSIAAAAVIGAGLFLGLKKRKHN